MRFLLSTLYALIFFTSISQPIIPRFEALGVNEGLSQNSVYSIYQDKEGYMWFGTADGLNRYDGDEIKVFKTKIDLSAKGNSNFIRGNLCEDENGNICFSTETGIYYYDRVQNQVKLAFSFPEQKTGIIYYNLLSISDDQTLWLINKTVGIASWQIKKRVWKIYPLQVDFKRQFSNQFAAGDAEDNIWFNMYQDDGMYKFNTTQKKIEHVFADKNLSGIWFGKGKSFCLSENKIYRFDSLTLRTDSCLVPSIGNKNFTALALYEDHYGRCWISSLNSGLLNYDFDHQKLNQYRHNSLAKKTLTSDLVRTLAEDRSGNLWIGTDEGGVCKLDLKPPLFNLFPHNEGEYSYLTNYFTKCFFEDEKRRIWFGTLNGFNIYDPTDGNIKHFEHNEHDHYSLPGNIVSAIFKDAEGKMWVGDSKGISIFNEKKKKFQSIPLELLNKLDSISPFVYEIIQLKNGDLMAATASKLLLIKKGLHDHYVATSKFKGGDLIPNPVTGVAGLDNDLWITSPLNGLYHISFLDDSLVIKETFLPGIDFRSLHADDSNPFALWIATGKGLMRFDTRSKKAELFDEKNGVVNSYVYGILEDEMHYLWMSTNGGISMFDKDTRRFVNYTWKDGLQSNEFNTGAFYKGASGTFYFGGVKGFNYFKPADAIKKITTTVPAIALTKITVNNNIHPQDSSFRKNHKLLLKHFENDLSFQLSALDFTLPEANKIQYKLEGWDDEWINSYTKNINYNNLTPGNYVFKARACNSSGVWSKEEQFSVIIVPPFWETWWFYSLIVILVTGIVILVTRYISQNRLKERIRQLEKQQAIEAERSRISKDMHDEIGSGLTRIALMTELMHFQQQLDKKTEENVNEIAGSARALVETMSEIIWAMNPKNDKLANLLAYLREQTGHYFEPFEVNYQIHFPDAVPDLQLSNEQRRNLFLVSKEALHNALKHSGATTIEFSAMLLDGRFQFSVSDNGKGINISSVRVGANGLKNMEQRMADIKGGIEWIQQNGSGTKANYWINI